MNHRPPTEMTGKSRQTNTGASDDTNGSAWFSTTQKGQLQVACCASNKSPDSNTRPRASPLPPTKRDSRDLERLRSRLALDHEQQEQEDSKERRSA